MADRGVLDVLVEQVFAKHVATDGMCDECTHQWPCPDYRIADDWKRQRADLIRAWRNRTGAELAAVSKYICAGCSTKDTGMLCMSCIEEVAEGAEGEPDSAEIIRDVVEITNAEGLADEAGPG